MISAITVSVMDVLVLLDLTYRKWRKCCIDAPWNSLRAALTPVASTRDRHEAKSTRGVIPFDSQGELLEYINGLELGRGSACFIHENMLGPTPVKVSFVGTRVRLDYYTYDRSTLEAHYDAGTPLSRPRVKQANA